MNSHCNVALIAYYLYYRLMQVLDCTGGPYTSRRAYSRPLQNLRCLCRQMNDAIRSPLGNMLHAHEGYQIEIRMTKIRDIPASGQPSRYSENNPVSVNSPGIYSVPRKAHLVGPRGRRQRTCDEKELARVIAQNHELNNVRTGIIRSEHYS